MTEKTGASAIDGAVLDGIRSLEGPGGQGLLEKVLTLYLADSLKLMEGIRSAAKSGEADVLRRSAHTLKSSSANVGATGVSDICRKIEGEVSAGNPPAADDPLLGKLEEEYLAARKGLQDILDSGRGGATGGR
jgi:HPt (histidine-containing phosphotransfer) domain-containing protein